MTRPARLVKHRVVWGRRRALSLSQPGRRRCFGRRGYGGETRREKCIAAYIKRLDKTLLSFSGFGIYILMFCGVPPPPPPPTPP